MLMINWKQAERLSLSYGGGEERRIRPLGVTQIQTDASAERKHGDCQ